MNQEHDALQSRVRKLESRNRIMTWIGITLFVCFVSVAAKSPKSSDVTQAQKFELRDAAGKLRAELYFSNGSPALQFFDAAGETRSILADDSSRFSRRAAISKQYSVKTVFRLRTDETKCS